MAKNNLKKRLFFFFVVMMHCAITILLFIENIKIDLDRKHKVVFSALKGFYAIAVKLSEDIFSFPLFKIPTLLDSLFFIKGFPGIIAVTLLNSIIQVSALYFLFIFICKFTRIKNLWHNQTEHDLF